MGFAMMKTTLPDVTLTEAIVAEMKWIRNTVKNANVLILMPIAKTSTKNVVLGQVWATVVKLLNSCKCIA